MERGDIYAIEIEARSGTESERQTVLVVSPSAFNQTTRMPIVVPITVGASSTRTAGFAVSLMASEGERVAGLIRCDQPRAIDLPAGTARKMGCAPVPVMDEVLAKIAAIFE